MKLRKLTICSIIATSIFSGAVFADPVTVNGGKITFNGEVTDGACAISGTDDSRIVTLDTVRAADFSAAGQYGNAKKAFQIKLVDCKTDTLKNVAISFTGQTDPSDETVLTNTAGAGSASNVGLAIFGTDGAVLPVGTTSTAIGLVKDTTINLSVDYKSTAASVSAGKVQSIANFQLTYN